MYIYRSCMCRKTLGEGTAILKSRFERVEQGIQQNPSWMDGQFTMACQTSSIVKNTCEKRSKLVSLDRTIGKPEDDVSYPRCATTVACQPEKHSYNVGFQKHSHNVGFEKQSHKGFEKPQTVVSSEKPKSTGFETAKVGYIRNLKKDGKKPPSSFGNSEHKNENTQYVHPYINRAVKGMNGDYSTKDDASKKKKNDGEEGPLSIRTYELLKLTPDEPLPDELSRIDPAMIEQVCNEVIDSSASVAWEDIAGQEPAKRLIQEVVVWPMMNPDIFKGARAPPKGILLFGPPGTGKTLLGKAIASNIDASFFSISASSLTSKWIGDGEKMVKALFAVAGWMAPSVIFIDEIDSLLSSRKSEGEHESSRRLKTEILVQMEGCDPASASRKVLLVGATNRPEELDEAARRRMPKQMYIPLPCPKARKEMIYRILGPSGSIAANLSDADVEKIVEKTDGYSGSDMKNLIQEACQGPIREAVRSAGAKVATLQEHDLRPVVVRDFAIAAKAQRASTEPSEILRYEEYNDKHGAKTVEDSFQSSEMDDDDDGW